MTEISFNWLLLVFVLGFICIAAAVLVEGKRGSQWKYRLGSIGIATLLLSFVVYSVNGYAAGDYVIQKAESGNQAAAIQLQHSELVFGAAGKFSPVTKSEPLEQELQINGSTKDGAHVNVHLKLIAYQTKQNDGKDIAGYLQGKNLNQVLLNQGELQADFDRTVTDADAQVRDAIDAAAFDQLKSGSYLTQALYSIEQKINQKKNYAIEIYLYK